ncbi:SE-domain-containing protein [Macrolepiota fuliginosa MF-IS2]|uniref:Squalene monooxygenase n=1 Tax=Macrolepiota fuliginosa MF-IS2 TaxID=1400762 RepID=A0A9P5X9M1_9AGAR|nr:SE-domain-containing protein [Macrolepiota fuliginosa MF-IS2]
MPRYDVLIVGAGIAGPALAHGLSTLPRAKKPRIALLERSLAEPDRIVGELLQPGGVIALRKLGLESCFEGIDAIPTRGYCVLDGGKSVHIPYPGGYEGRSFHHGRFIMSLRGAARRAEGVDLIEATATDLIEEAGRVVGVKTTKKTGETELKEEYRADIVIIADGCFSNFRSTVMGRAVAKPVTKSQFCGAVLEDVTLPIPNHGTVALIKGSGPVLMYQISKHDTRILIDIKQPLPADLKSHILNRVVPQLPSSLHTAIHTALDKDRLRRMPNSFLPPVAQGTSGTKAGAILLGDAWNMRHPLTGGGMTVALSDVVLLRSLLGQVDDWSNWRNIQKMLNNWHWQRKPLASTVNILSVALYDLFGADDEYLAVLRTGCFKYFERGGECINGPVSLLSGIAPSPLLLASHFFSVAFYSIWVMFMHPRLVSAPNEKPIYAVARPTEYPMLLVKSVGAFWTACVVFGPLLWSELRWWSPDDSRARNKVLFQSALAIGVVAISVTWTLQQAL